MSKKSNQMLFFDAIRRPKGESKLSSKSLTGVMAERAEVGINVEAMRHSLAHIMAAAIQELWPQAKFGVGPVIENGFYYDVDLDQTLNPEDLERVEAKMAEIVEADYEFEHFDLDIDDAIEKVRIEKQSYKVELLKDLKKHGTTVAKDIDRTGLGLNDDDEKITTVSFYRSGKFEDLCRGPHVNSTGEVGAYKLTKVSGAYWRGNEENPQMQRVYGVAFATQQELKEYFALQEEAEKRDHRKLGQELDLFTFSDLVGSGLPLYTPRGTVLIEELKNALREISNKHEMQLVSIPHIGKIDLYQASGHADKFSAELFQVKSHYEQDFVLKPVNCPHHTQIYASKPRSYRDLPLRYIEQTMQYRDEKPGQIGGLQRTRGFTVDDGHTFCRVDQLKQEASTLVEIIKAFYENLGLWGEHWVSLSVRSPGADKDYIGEPEDWDKAETMLQEVDEQHGLDAKRMEGEAAIYGPKLDFMFSDALGRETQLATIQLDFAMPKRFNLSYTDAEGAQQTPVLIHRAILGSFERFIMLLIEHFAGKFPVWLAPEQVRLATVNDSSAIAGYAQKLRQQMREAGIRVELDDSNESVGKKIRAAELMKVPYTIVVGEKEVESGEVTPRVRKDLGEEAKPLAVEAFIKAVAEEARDRSSKSSL
jgi:threonyl-tRNA synthetase